MPGIYRMNINTDVRPPAGSWGRRKLGNPSPKYEPPPAYGSKKCLQITVGV
jgi:hypothetical protein